MRIGIDYWQTLSQAPDKYRQIAQAFEDSGIGVYIVSAVGESDVERIIAEIQSLNIPHTVISIIICSGEEVPQEKLGYAIENKLDFFIDDRMDVCELLRKNGIITLNAINL